MDTAAFLWAASDPRKLPERVRALIENEEAQLFMSAVSAWEIAIKHAAGKLTLSRAPERLMPEVRQTYGIDQLPLDEDSTFHLRRLPDFHRDPFDRMLICQAIHHGMAFLTPDEAIHRYPVRTIW